MPVQKRALKQPHILTDKQGKTVAIQVDPKTFDALVEAYEEHCDVQTFDKMKTVVDAQVERGEYSTLNQLCAEIKN
ncbi:MAG: hypothetical protein HGB19_02910 [Chlorobiales bacterium]|nr:hypothetical protein [Chlorobiales bacterium]